VIFSGLPAVFFSGTVFVRPACLPAVFFSGLPAVIFSGTVFVRPACTVFVRPACTVFVRISAPALRVFRGETQQYFHCSVKWL
jgi:hypothetical protein